MHGTTSAPSFLPVPPQPLLPALGAKGRPSLPPHVLSAQCHPPGPQPILCTTMGSTCPPESGSYPNAPSAHGPGEDPAPATCLTQVLVDALRRTKESAPTESRTYTAAEGLVSTVTQEIHANKSLEINCLMLFSFLFTARVIPSDTDGIVLLYLQNT